MSANRNFAIDWLKGLMMLFIMLLHTCQFPFFRHGYIAVDVFFFIAGYYLMQHFERHRTTAVRYSWSRLKQFFLPYILCFAFSCILRYKGLTSFTDFDSFLERYSKFAFYLTFTEEIGPRILVEHIIQGSWFISVILIAGFLLYGLLEYNKDLALKVLLPLGCILGYTFIFTAGPGIMNWSRIGAVSLPLLRGFCAMAGGILLYSLFADYRDAIERRSILVNLAALLSFILFVAIMFAKQAFDVCIIVTIPWMVLSALIDASWLNCWLEKIHGGLLPIIGKNSLYILFAHPPIVMIVNWVNNNYLEASLKPVVIVALVLALTVPATIILKKTCILIREKWLKKVPTQ